MSVTYQPFDTKKGQKEFVTKNKKMTNRP